MELTKESILNLEAGRKTDALIAHFLGMIAFNALITLPADADVNQFMESIPHFSTDANQALQLAWDTYDTTGLSGLCITYDRMGNRRWYAEFDDYVRTSEAYADSPALAICKAWLLWRLEHN